MSANLGRVDFAGTDREGEIASAPGASAAPGLRARLFALLRGGGDGAAARRLAGGAFAMRVVNAGLGFATQIFLARWMGESQYGIYAYIWVWLLFIGGVGSLGIPVSVLKFVPDYRLRGDLPGLRALLRYTRLLGALPSVVVAAAIAIALLVSVNAAGLPFDAMQEVIVALLALVALPLYVLTDIQTGIARAYDFADLGLTADYLFRPVLLLLFVGILALSDGPSDAIAVMAATLAAVALTAAGQGVLLQKRLVADVPAGPRRADGARWAQVSAPLLAVTTFTLLLGATDILALKLFVAPEEIGRYFAATKILAVASFVAYGVSATSSHRFAAQAVSGDRDAARRLAAETVRWTFWPTLAVIVGLVLLARPLLSLFGPGFAEAWPVVAILSLGLLAQAAVGPADRALAMLDHGAVTAWIYAAAFGANVALAFVLIPVMGPTGAALSTALAFVLKSALLYVSARRRLGLHMFVLSRAPALPASMPLETIETEIIPANKADSIAAAWQDLAGRALEPNAFYLPGLARAGLRHLPERQGAQLVLAWDRSNEGRRLVGLLPVVVARGRYLNPFRIRRAAEFYGTLSTPLLDASRAEPALAGMLEALGRAGTASLLLPFLHDGGPAATALDGVCASRDLAQLDLGRHARAMLRSPLSGGDYVRATLETRRRKEADRQRRRLADQGALAFQVVSEPNALPAALDAFLGLEAAGWKGRLGSDLRHASGAEAFIRDTAAALSHEHAFRIATLTLDGRVIAAGLVAIAGRRAFYMKTAYDESLARFSPGLLLTLDLTAHLLDDPGIDDADSIAVADHPMIDRIWTERFPVVSRLISTRPGAGVLFHLAAACERLRIDLGERIKPIRGKLRAFRQPAANADSQKSPTPAAR